MAARASYIVFCVLLFVTLSVSIKPKPGYKIYREPQFGAPMYVDDIELTNYENVYEQAQNSYHQQLNALIAEENIDGITEFIDTTNFPVWRALFDSVMDILEKNNIDTEKYHMIKSAVEKENEAITAINHERSIEASKHVFDHEWDLPEGIKEKINEKQRLKQRHQNQLEFFPEAIEIE